MVYEVSVAGTAMVGFGGWSVVEAANRYVDSTKPWDLNKAANAGDVAAAATLREVLTTKNAGDRHGTTSHLGPAELSDLETYLLSLDR